MPAPLTQIEQEKRDAWDARYGDLKGLPRQVPADVIRQAMKTLNEFWKPGTRLEDEEREVLVRFDKALADDIDNFEKTKQHCAKFLAWMTRRIVKRSL